MSRPAAGDEPVEHLEHPKFLTIGTSLLKCEKGLESRRHFAGTLL